MSISAMTISGAAGPVARITIDRAAKVNALDAASTHELAAAIRAAGATLGARLVVIEGRGEKGFCGGADIAEFASGVEALARQGDALVDLTQALESCPVPVLSVIHGRTLGAGGMIAALSDLVIASDNLLFGFPEIRFFMFPVVVEAALIGRVSERMAWQLCASGRLLDAAEARDLGLVSEILAHDGFAAAVEERIAFYAEAAPVLRTTLRRPEAAMGPAATRVKAALPAMLHNYQMPGVLDAILQHMPGRHKK